MSETKDDREARLRRQLRANLARRKAKARSLATGTPAPLSEDGENETAPSPPKPDERADPA